MQVDKLVSVQRPALSSKQVGVTDFMVSLKCKLISDPSPSDLVIDLSFNALEVVRNSFSDARYGLGTNLEGSDKRGGG